MLPSRAPPLAQTDLLRLDQFLHSRACGVEAMGLSHAHGFLTAIASGPEALEPSEWLRLMFDEPVFDSGEEAQEMLGLALRLYQDIENSLHEDGRFRPVLDYVRDAGGTRVDAHVWCHGFIAAFALFGERWTRQSRRVLEQPLSFIFQLAQTRARDSADYARLCDALSLAAEAVHRYWRTTTTATA
jgi:uncharacterized protein